MYYVGGFLGCLISSWLANKWGRKICVTIAISIVMVAGALMAGSANVSLANRAISD